MSKQRLVSRVVIDKLITKALMPLSDVGTDRRLFTAILSAETVDKQNEILIIDEIEKVLPIWFARGAPIMDTHTNRHVGKGLTYQRIEVPTGKANEKVAAIQVTGEIFKDYGTDAMIWQAITSGEYKGVSFGGATKGDRQPVQLANGGFGFRLSDLEQYEMSVCKSPANPLSIIVDYNRLAKSVPPSVMDGMIRNMRTLENGSDVRVKCHKLGCYVEQDIVKAVVKDKLFKAKNMQEMNTILKSMGLSQIQKPLPSDSMYACMSHTKDNNKDWDFKQRVAACLNATGMSKIKKAFPPKKEEDDKKEKPKDSQDKKPFPAKEDDKAPAEDKPAMEAPMEQEQEKEQVLYNPDNTDNAVAGEASQVEQPPSMVNPNLDSGYNLDVSGTGSLSGDMGVGTGAQNQLTHQIDINPDHSMEISLPEVDPQLMYIDEIDEDLLELIATILQQYEQGQLNPQQAQEQILNEPKIPEQQQTAEPTDNFNNESTGANDNNMSANDKGKVQEIKEPEKKKEPVAKSEGQQSFDLEAFMKKSMADLGSSIDSKIGDLRTELKSEIDALKPTKKDGDNANVNTKEASPNQETKLENKPYNNPSTSEDDKTPAGDKVQLETNKTLNKTSVTARPPAGTQDTYVNKVSDPNNPGLAINNPVFQMARGQQMSMSDIAAQINNKGRYSQLVKSYVQKSQVGEI